MGAATAAGSAARHRTGVPRVTRPGRRPGGWVSLSGVHSVDLPSCEDDPERAVRCGLAILEAMKELALDVRVGVNTGEAVVAADRHHSEVVVGDVVNTAARLEGVAPVGSVLVGEATFRATRRLFDYEPLAPVRVKGKAAPLPVWLAASARGRPGVAVDQPPATPFLGREGERDRLRRAYASARDEASVRLVTVTGEPGVGKSRLVPGAPRVRGRPARAGRLAPGPLPALRGGHQLLGAGGGAQGPGRPGAARTGTPEQDEIFTAWRRFLDAVAARRPLGGRARRPRSPWPRCRTTTPPACSPPCSGGPSTRTRPTPPCWAASAATRSTPSRSAACSTTGACWSATGPRCGSRPPTRSFPTRSTP
jgi:hypothetical protein